MPSQFEYDTYFCKVHNKHIYYFKTDNYITGYFHCLDCIKVNNDGKFVYPYGIPKQEI